jgi:hypothetical protein
VKLTKAAALWTSLIFGLVILTILLVFIAQNTDSASFAFFGWHWTLPLRGGDPAGGGVRVGDHRARRCGPDLPVAPGGEESQGGFARLAGFRSTRPVVYPANDETPDEDDTRAVRGRCGSCHRGRTGRPRRPMRESRRHRVRGDRPRRCQRSRARWGRCRGTWRRERRSSRWPGGAAGPAARPVRFGRPQRHCGSGGASGCIPGVGCLNVG